MSIIRQNTSDLEIINMMADNEHLETVASYFDRRADHSLIREAVKKRYGTSIRAVVDKNNPEVTIETYVREQTEIQVNSGIFEAISIGFGQKVIGAVANIFSEPGQVFSLVHETKDSKALEDADKLLKKYRKNGYRKTLTEADERSIQVGSCAVFTSYSGAAFNYKSLIASRVRFYYPETIIETVGDVNVTRAPDQTDVEDCYAVVLRISTSNDAKDTYLAIMGRSVEWEQGRYVQYTADRLSTEIPAPDDDKIVSEYLGKDGKPANPLSIMAQENLDDYVPEYPITIVRGLVKDDTTPMPTSTSLYQDSIEFDVAASHIMGKGQEAAGGANVLSLDETGASKPLPRTLQGDIVTQPGQTLEHISKNANDSKVAYELAKDEMVDAAAGWGVPDFMASSEDHTVDASSGIALEIKSRPLVKQRDRRIDDNESEVSKQFEIEKWLIVAHDTDAPEDIVNTLKECSQFWQPGDLRLPQNKKELMEELTSAQALGIMDTIAAIKRYYQLATDTEAIALYEKFKKRAKEYPPIQITEPVKKPVGLLRSQKNNESN